VSTKPWRKDRSYGMGGKGDGEEIGARAETPRSMAVADGISLKRETRSDKPLCI